MHPNKHFKRWDLMDGTFPLIVQKQASQLVPSYFLLGLNMGLLACVFQMYDVCVNIQTAFVLFGPGGGRESHFYLNKIPHCISRTILLAF